MIRPLNLDSVLKKGNTNRKHKKNKPKNMEKKHRTNWLAYFTTWPGEYQGGLFMACEHP